MSREADQRTTSTLTYEEFDRPMAIFGTESEGYEAVFVEEAATIDASELITEAVECRARTLYILGLNLELHIPFS